MNLNNARNTSCDSCSSLRIFFLLFFILSFLFENQEWKFLFRWNFFHFLVPSFFLVETIAIVNLYARKEIIFGAVLLDFSASSGFTSTFFSILSSFSFSYFVSLSSLFIFPFPRPEILIIMTTISFKTSGSETGSGEK